MPKLPLRRPVFAVIVSFVVIGAARSADLAVPPLAPAANFSGWYLRGDVGFSNHQVGSLFNQNYTRFVSSANNFWPDRYTRSKYEWTFMFNGYADLGTWYGITPFLGAGVGFTRNTIINFGDVNVAEGAGKSNIAWPLYAGRVTPAMAPELSYRYIDLGDATAGTMFSHTGVSDTRVLPSDFARSQAGPAIQLWRLRLSTAAVIAKASGAQQTMSD